MQHQHMTRNHLRTCTLLCFLVVVTVTLTAVYLSSCSDQVLYTGTDTLSVVEGTGMRPPVGGTGALGLVTEAPTGGSISIQPSGDPYENAAHVMRVDFLNVGDADAILVRADDTVILVDTGETNDYQKITSTLSNYGIQAIDHLIITHYDNDHIGTAAQLLKDYPVRHVYMPDYIRDSRLYRSLADVLGILSESGQITVSRLTEDAEIELANGRVHMNPTHLYAPGAILGSDDSHSMEENNYSLITTITFGDVRLLLAGDAEGDRMAEFAASQPVGIAYNILKIPHHGRYDKELGDFLRAAKGDLRYCMVSVGDEDLVEASLVTAMRSAGAGVYYTYNGDIRLATDGMSMIVEQGN